MYVRVERDALGETVAEHLEDDEDAEYGLYRPVEPVVVASGEEYHVRRDDRDREPDRGEVWRVLVVEFLNHADEESEDSSDTENEVVVGSTDEVLDAGFVIDEDSPESILDVFGVP